MGHSFRHVLVTLDEDDKPAQWMCVYCQESASSVDSIGLHLKTHKAEFDVYSDKVRLVINTSQWSHDQWVGVKTVALEFGTEKVSQDITEQKLNLSLSEKDREQDSVSGEDENNEAELSGSDHQGVLSDPEGGQKSDQRATKAVARSTKLKTRGQKSRSSEEPVKTIKTQTSKNYKRRQRTGETSGGEKQQTSKTGLRKAKSQSKRKAEEREFVCSRCNWKTGRHFNYHRHVLKSCCSDNSGFTCQYCEKEISVSGSKSNYGQEHRKCETCGKNFYQLDEYAEHVSQGCDAIQPGKLLCLVCRKTFKFVSDLESHITDCHMDKDLDSDTRKSQVSDKMGRVNSDSHKNLFLCGVCDWSSDHHSNYHRHCATHCQSEGYECNYCNKPIDPGKFYISKKIKMKKEKRKQVATADRKCEAGVDMVCEHCAFTTRRRDVFTKHQVEHIPEHQRQIHCCELCSYETFYASSLKMHMAVKHEKKTNVQLTPDVILCCELCGTFTDESREAMITHKQETCPYRDKDIGTLKQLEGTTDNSAAQTSEKMQASIEDQKITPFQIKVTNPMPAGRMLKSVKKKKGTVKKKVFVCDYCEFVCSRRWNMVRHKQCLHKRSAVECHMCGFTTKSMPRLVAHYRTFHSVTPPLEVTSAIEQSKFDRRHNFVDREKPKRIMNNKRKVCHLCGKHVLARTMKSHLTLTHGERSTGKLFRCSWEGCTYETTLYTNLSRHNKRVHRKDKSRIKKTAGSQKCENCSFVASTQRELKEHKKTVHPVSMPNQPVRDLKGLTTWPMGQSSVDLFHHLSSLSHVPPNPNLPPNPTTTSPIDYANLLQSVNKTISQETSQLQSRISRNETTAMIMNQPGCVETSSEQQVTVTHTLPLEKVQRLNFHQQF